MTSRKATWEVAAVGMVFLVLLGLGFRQVWTEATVYREALLSRRIMDFHGKIQSMVSNFRREEDGFFQAMIAAGPSPEHAQTWEGLDRLLQRTFLCAQDGVMA